MKRILSCVMAVALVAGMGVSALAADAYNSLGDLTLSGMGWYLTKSARTAPIISRLKTWIPASPLPNGMAPPIR